MSPPVPEIVLASASRTRAGMLEALGLAFTIDRPEVDEGAIKCAMRAKGASAGEAALALAEAKAGRVALRHAGALVIGADQILAKGDRWFDKPLDRADAKTQLVALGGTDHELVTAACVVASGRLDWKRVEVARLVMHPLSGDAIDRYLEGRAGRDTLGSPGAYQIEGGGAALFESIEGDYFAILGLPLLSLLAHLRARGVALP